MSWWEANAQRRKGIQDYIGSIQQTAAEMARLNEQRAGRIQGGFTEMARSLGDIIQARKARQFATSEREAGQEYGTEERIAGQEYGTSERLGEQGYQTGERIAGQEFATGPGLEAEKTLQNLRNIGSQMGRSQQNINTDLRESRINAEDDWLVAIRIQNPQAVGPDGTPIPAAITDKDRASLISFYMDIPGVDEGKAALWADRFIGQLGAVGAKDVGAVQTPREYPRGTSPVAKILETTPEQQQAKEAAANQIQQYVSAIQARVEQLRSTPQAEPEERAFGSWLRDLNTDIGRGHGGGLMGMSEGALSRILKYVTELAGKYGLSLDSGSLKESVRELK